MLESRRRRWKGAGCGLWPALLCVMAQLTAPPAAQACGGCFNQGSAAPVVAHRMAFALSEGRTVLWDQFQYAGPAEDFSWVLPITPGAYLELSSDAWFDALETVTAVRVQPPVVTCASRGSSAGCGADDDVVFSVNDSDTAVPGPSVAVLRRESIGPYETVTLRSDSGDALTGWLLDNGYLVPEDVVPIIAQYVAEGADFIALRLQPNANVRQMQPVRVITPQGPPILPLRMVAAGAAESVDIVLYVIGDQRFEMPDFTEVTVDPDQLRYDFQGPSSNYLALRQQALSFNGGQAFLTAFAQEGFFSQPGAFGPGGAPDFISTYVRLAADDEDVRANATECSAIAERARTNQLVVPGCQPGDVECTPPGDDELEYGALACEGLEDVAAALLGHRPAETWLTRLELRVPRSALTADCVILPSMEQLEVSNLLRPERFDNPPCEQPVFSSSLSTGAPRGLGLGVFALLLAGVLVRRVGRRRG